MDESGRRPALKLKPQRLADSADFRRVREQGRCWSDPRLVLCTYPNSQASLRVGYSVSKRIGGAVRRNRIKRLMRESIRAYCDLLEPGWDIVIIARQRVSLANYWDVQCSVGHLLGLAGVFGVVDASGASTGVIV